MINISENEAASLRSFIRFYFIDSIKNDPDIDSLLYMWNILNFYERTGGLKEDGYIDYESNNK